MYPDITLVCSAKAKTMIENSGFGYTPAELAFRWLWVLTVFCGPFLALDAVWTLADILNGLMALPNLIALIALSGVVMKITKNYVDRTFRGAKVKPMLSAIPEIQREQEQGLAAEK